MGLGGDPTVVIAGENSRALENPPRLDESQTGRPGGRRRRGDVLSLALTWARLIAVEFPLALGAADLPHAYRRPISAASHVGVRVMRPVATRSDVPDRRFGSITAGLVVGRAVLARNRSGTSDRTSRIGPLPSWGLDFTASRDFVAPIGQSNLFRYSSWKPVCLPSVSELM